MWWGEVGDRLEGELLPPYPAPLPSSASSGVVRGEGKWSTVRSGREPVLLEMGMWGPMGSCSCDGYMLQHTRVHRMSTALLEKELQEPTRFHSCDG